MNDKVDISTTKLSVSEISFHKKVTNLSPIFFPFCFQGKAKLILDKRTHFKPPGRGCSTNVYTGRLHLEVQPYTSFCLEKGTPFVYYLPLRNGTPFTNPV